jgi:FkbM family methyltransferase
VLENDQRALKLTEANGDLNPDSMSLWNALIELGEPWDLVLDVGANYGEMLAGSTRTPGTRVVAFEPNPSVAALLRRTVAELPFPVEIVESAVSSAADARVSFLYDKTWSGTSHLAAVEGGVTDHRYEQIEVPATTLDVCFPEPTGSALVKIDVEGAEMRVLAGAEQFLARTERVAVMMEILHMPVQEVWAVRHEYQMALWCGEAGGPVVIDAGSAEELGQLLHSGEYYRQDAVFLSGRDAADLTAALRTRWGTSSGRAERRRARLEAAQAEQAAAWDTLREERDELSATTETLASRLDESERQTAALRADKEQLSLELDVRAAELEHLRSELARSARQLADAGR